MSHLLVQDVERKFKKANQPKLVPGAIVKVYQKIKEGEKERIQIFEGLIIAINHGLGASKTMTVRKIVEGIGVEKIFPLNSPLVDKVEVIRVGRVRRAKLFYMRGIQGKAAKLKEKLGAKKRMLLGMIDESIGAPVVEATPTEPVVSQEETPAETKTAEK